MDRDRVSIWGCTDCPTRLYVEIATNPEFTDVRTVRGPGALSVTDYTAKVDLEGLPRGEQIYYRVIFERLTDANSYMAIIGSYLQNQIGFLILVLWIVVPLWVGYTRFERTDLH